MTKAIFPGSFDPFTIGHADIISRALPLFDHIIIAIGQNSEKNCLFPLDQRLTHISKAFENQEKISVVAYTNLTAEFAREQGAKYIIRGIRCVADFEYERNMAEANKQLCGIETVLLYTKPELAHISSTLVRDLYRHGRDIKPYII